MSKWVDAGVLELKYCPACETEVDSLNGECIGCGQPTEDIKVETKYAFWIELTDGQEVRWSGLTLRQVQSMNKMTDTRLPLNIKAFGWEEQK
jgi:hypothetical protein